MKFYPADWQSDEGLRSCSLAARGLWVEMLAIMHKAEPVGHLLVSGRAPANRVLAILCGATVKETERCLAELEDAGVFSRNEAGVIFSRRMVRDEERAAEDKANGAKGGHPALRGGLTPPVNRDVDGGDKAQRLEARVQKESSARDARLPSDLVDRVWSAAPQKARTRSSRSDTAKALAAAVKRGAEPDDILAGLQAYWRSDDATKDDGAYVKGVHRMIADDR
ncbi:MAG: hypothetical protein IOB84_07845, partial [Brevundimonas sp.]|nr:hypothetical protein [Brevundimonas sp.]